MEGFITNIQKCSVHDGPGIRTTVFFKGCPLKCKWCHNPETQSYMPEMFHNSDTCTLCKICISKCDMGAISFDNPLISYDPQKCTMCEKCVDFCPSSCIEITGKKMSSRELLSQIEKDIPFYEESGGGATFSGGEAMTHIDFLHETISLCKDSQIHVTVDTCGYAPSESFEKIADLVDLFLYDIKHMDENIHKEYTGVSNALILHNLRLISRLGCKVQLRIPLIDGFNTDEKNIRETAFFSKELGITGVSLLPYHSIGNYKYPRLGMGVALQFEKPSDEKLQNIKIIFEEYGLNAKIGG
ncbi:pyruvate formate lyase activating enzyme [Peptoclostridium litorale DSM 5388]|uniref:4-hydroxyphenylacetate decarboxylase activating enzyme n=1 Tax=Peptoclostridium litorale DSM 5388 TaxID=1121324 RepID=A0A069RHY7_PEPLI|nr:glycyl-radical enzyme activating protein [Peptoclostridium litorale]KDR96614.1 4-hydroxyphenylacetate decarboxylase activating enzyme [Peptoclostridium litorale DSM 5388]SIN68455.1 pyruvate formate lyase activating enzyme [Peptoclostridium litorale DSM 5388]